MKRLPVLVAILALSVVAQAPKQPAAPPAKVPAKQVPATAAAAAETKSAPDRPTGSQRVFILKYADPVETATLLRAFGARAMVDNQAHAVAVMSAFPEVLSAIDDAIQRLDVPAVAQNIELTAYYLIGGNTASPLGSPLPKDLESLSNELAAGPAVKNYRLLDTLTVRMRAGQGAETSGSAGPVAAGSPVIATDLRVGTATTTSDGGSVRVDRLSAGVKMPVAAGGSQFTMSDLAVNADVDIKEGQRVLVGRVGMNRDQALFLVLMARIAK